MCIFNKPVTEVRQTRILVSNTKSGRQLTVYENFVGVEGSTRTAKARKKVKNLEDKHNEERKNAMILPCPLKEGDKVDLIDLSGIRDLFQRLSNCYPTLLDLKKLSKETRSRSKAKKKRVFRCSTNGSVQSQCRRGFGRFRKN